jgi:acyl phosphate:glycerol-3-phosphate acyltransferase
MGARSSRGRNDGRSGNDGGKNSHCGERGDEAISVVMNVVAAALLAYLLGSIPFGLLLTLLAGIGDIRRVGSGNIGATNVLRTGNKVLAAVTLVFDVGKGVAAVLIGALWSTEAALVASVAAVIGHMFPVWLRFRGGKGVATALGVLLALAWPVGVIGALLWLATALISHYSSLSALVAAVAVPGIAWLVADPPHALAVSVIAILVVLRHRGNIQRLLAGTESRISFRKG